MDQTKTITAEMLQDLPAPVQRYLTYSGILGKPAVQSVRIQFSGRFRRGADQPWMRMTADQVYTIPEPGFVWNARFIVAGLPLMRARDTYRNGTGHMFARLAWLIPIFDVRGKELDQGTMVRFLQEMMWYPSAFLQPYIRWSAVDDQNADVTFTDHGKSVSGRMTFDAQGRVTQFVAQRFRESNGNFIWNTWCTPVTAYGEFAGLKLPAAGQAVWKLEEGDLQYADLQILRVEYDSPVR